MNDSAESRTIKPLREMRREMREGFAEINARFDVTNLRIDGVTHMMTLPAGHSHNMADRLTAVEAAQADTP